MNKHFARTALAGVALVSLLGLSACKQKAADAQTQGHGPVKLSAVVLNASTVSSGIITTGTVLAEQQVSVQSQAMGMVTRIGFPEGGHVSKGQVLVQLDDSQLRAQLEKAQAALDLAQVQEKRVKAQADAGAISQQDYDSAEAQLASAKSDVDLLQAQLAMCQIKAPFSGEAGLRQVELGVMMQPGNVVTDLQDMSSLRVEFSVPEDEAPGVHVGMPVHFTVTGRQDTLTASIYAIEPGLDTLTRLLYMRARLAPPKGGLRVGSFATVVVPLQENAALWVPAQAVVESAQGSQVWLVKDGKAVLQIFTAGTRTAESVEATGGLAAGDTVLLSGQMQLKTGAPVTPSIVQE